MLKHWILLPSKHKNKALSMRISNILVIKKLIWRRCGCVSRGGQEEERYAGNAAQSTIFIDMILCQCKMQWRKWAPKIPSTKRCCSPIFHSVRDNPTQHQRKNNKRFLRFFPLLYLLSVRGSTQVLMDNFYHFLISLFKYPMYLLTHCLLKICDWDTVMMIFWGSKSWDLNLDKES